MQHGHNPREKTKVNSHVSLSSKTNTISKPKYDSEAHQFSMNWQTLATPNTRDALKIGIPTILSESNIDSEYSQHSPHRVTKSYNIIEHSNQYANAQTVTRSVHTQITSLKLRNQQKQTCRSWAKRFKILKLGWLTETTPSVVSIHSKILCSNQYHKLRRSQKKSVRTATEFPQNISKISPNWKNSCKKNYKNPKKKLWKSNCQS